MKEAKIKGLNDIKLQNLEFLRREIESQKAIAYELTRHSRKVNNLFEDLEHSAELIRDMLDTLSKKEKEK